MSALSSLAVRLNVGHYVRRAAGAKDELLKRTLCPARRPDTTTAGDGALQTRCPLLRGKSSGQTRMSALSSLAVRLSLGITPGEPPVPRMNC
jgi:hypothetical protein